MMMMKKQLSTLFVALMFSLLSGSTTADGDVIPHSTSAGETVTLACPFETTYDAFDRTTWELDGTEVAFATECSTDSLDSCKTNISDPGKYALEGRLSTGFNLVVFPIQLEDNGVYECTAVLSTGVKTTTIKLIVTHPPDSLEVVDVNRARPVAQGGVANVVLNRLNFIDCTVPSPCNPPPAITWYYGDVSAVTRDQVDQSDDERIQLVTSSKVIELSPTADDNGKELMCSAMHDGLTSPLQVNFTLEVGNLPESPANVAVLESATTTDSFTVTWQQSASGGKPQTFVVRYCLVFASDECSEISGITQTRLKIGSLRPFTSYEVTVNSTTVFGTSENNNIITSSTKPLSPAELGVSGVYDERNNNVLVTRSDNSTDALPTGLCFQLVYPSTDVESDCVVVGESLTVAKGQSWSEVEIIAYGNHVSSSPSPLQTESVAPGVNVSLVAGIAAGSGCLLIVIVLIIGGRVLWGKRGGTSGNGALASRSLPADPNPYPSVQRYSVANYQEVDNTVTHSYQDQTPMISGGQAGQNDLYTLSEPPSKRQPPYHPKKDHPYYSGNINRTPAATGTVQEKYAYVDPNL